MVTDTPSTVSICVLITLETRVTESGTRTWCTVLHVPSLLHHGRMPCLEQGGAGMGSPCFSSYCLWKGTLSVY